MKNLTVSKAITVMTAHMKRLRFSADCGYCSIRDCDYTYQMIDNFWVKLSRSAPVEDLQKLKHAIIGWHFTLDCHTNRIAKE